MKTFLFIFLSFNLFAENKPVTPDRLNYFFPMVGSGAATDMMSDFFINSAGEDYVKTDKWNVQNEATGNYFNKTIVSVDGSIENRQFRPHYAVGMNYEKKENSKKLRDVTFVSEIGDKDFIAEFNDKGTLDSITFKAPFSGTSIPATVDAEGCRKFLSQKMFENKSRKQILENSAQCFGMMKEGLELFKGFTQKENKRQISRIKAFAQKSNVLRRNPQYDEENPELKKKVADISMNVAVYNYFIERVTRLCVDLAGPDKEATTAAPRSKRNTPDRSSAPSMTYPNH